MTVTICHNPACGTSRNVLAQIWLMIVPMLLKIGLGVLVEVPVMLSAVRLAGATRTWYETPHRAGEE